MSTPIFLIPFINIDTLLKFIIGSGVSSQETNPFMRFTQAIDNIENAKFYIESSKSDAQYRYRLFRVGKDTFIVNVIALNGSNIAFSAGVLANQIADDYLKQIFETDYDLREVEKLNMEIFKTVAVEQGRDPNDVIGTRLFRENVPEYMKELLYIIPDEEDSRPDDKNSGQFDQNSQTDDSSNLNITEDNEDSAFQFKNAIESWLNIKMIDKDKLLTPWVVKTSDGNILKGYE